MSLIDAIPHIGKIDARPWPRAIVDEDGWRNVARELPGERFTLLSLWAEADAVYMALADAQISDIAVVSLAHSQRRFPSVGAVHPPAIRLERAIRDLYGI